MKEIVVSHISGNIVSVVGEDECNPGKSREHIIPLESKLSLADDKNDSGSNVFQVSHPTSYADTMLHIFKANIGSGLLAMGDAFKNGGIVFATVATALIGITCVHAQHMLLNASEELHQQMKRDRPPDYAETVGLAFQHGPVKLRPLAPTMKMLVNIFLCVTQLGFCCIYFVFISESVKMICDTYGIYLDLSVHMIFTLIPIVLASMVRNLKYLTPFSTLANILMILGVSVVVYESCQDLPPIQSREYIASWKQLPLFLGTAVYAFEGIGLVLPLKSEMRKPEQFQMPFGVLNVGMVLIGSIFMTVGFLGYLQYGEDVKGSLTLNLPSESVLSNVVRGIIAIGVLFTYPLQLYVPVGITWPILRKKYAKRSPVVKELGYRLLLVIVTFILAQSIPKLNLFISLVGAISSTALALMFPPILDIIMSASKHEITCLRVLKNTCILLVGIFIFLTGTFESISSIINAFVNTS